LIPSLLSIVISYFLGSISSAYIIGRIAGNMDMRTEEPDGRISASAVYQKLGLLPFALVVILDTSLSFVAVLIAGTLTDSFTIMVIAGLTAVVGHNWSIFLKFKGGLGATAILGALSAVIAWQISYALVIAGIVFVTTHKSGLSTAFGLVGSSGALMFQNGVDLIAMYPLLLFSLMLLKKYQVARSVRQVGQ
jgi:glycerol-3-phosphate acyltransferase PlsY